MRKHRQATGARRSMTIITAALFIGAAFGLGLATQLHTPPASAESEDDALFPVNENGQTYGSLADAPSDQQAPDLILVELDDGSEAYVLSEDLFAAEGGDVSSPDEAVEYMERESSENLGDVSGDSVDGGLPLYTRDGTPLAEEWDGLGTNGEAVTED
ncbi:hypothetical protein V1260_02125 [Brachybacterium sp. J144]|nr:hypothetical protein [Brachybacterium sp. J144]